MPAIPRQQVVQPCSVAIATWKASSTAFAGRTSRRTSLTRQERFVLPKPVQEPELERVVKLVDRRLAPVIRISKTGTA